MGLAAKVSSWPIPMVFLYLIIIYQGQKSDAGLPCIRIFDIVTRQKHEQAAIFQKKCVNYECFTFYILLSHL